MANACNFAGLAIWRVVPFRERCVVKFCPGMCEDYLSEAQKCTLNLGDGSACWRNLFNKQTRMQSLVRNSSPWLAQRCCFKPVDPMEISSLPSRPHQRIHTAVRKCCDLSAQRPSNRSILAGSLALPRLTMVSAIGLICLSTSYLTSTATSNRTLQVVRSTCHLLRDVR